MRATFHHDSNGRIRSVVIGPDPSAATPPTGVFASPDLHVSEVELPDEFRGRSILELHEGYRVDRSGAAPVLIAVEDRPQRPDCMEQRGSSS